MVYTIEEIKKEYLGKGYGALTQCERILKYIAWNGSISQREAMNELGIYRLASRINDLKRRGYNIVGETKTGRNRYGEKTSFKVYRLEETSELSIDARRLP